MTTSFPLLNFIDPDAEGRVLKRNLLILSICLIWLSSINTVSIHPTAPHASVTLSETIISYFLTKGRLFTSGILFITNGYLLTNYIFFVYNEYALRLDNTALKRIKQINLRRDAEISLLWGDPSNACTEQEVESEMERKVAQQYLEQTIKLKIKGGKRSEIRSKINCFQFYLNLLYPITIALYSLLISAPNAVFLLKVTWPY